MVWDTYNLHCFYRNKEHTGVNKIPFLVNDEDVGDRVEGDTGVVGTATTTTSVVSNAACC